MAKVTIIIPVKNGEKVILRAIKSAQNQNYQNLEIIIIDNGSTDDTAKYVKSVALYDSRVKYIYTSIKGKSHARNVGLQHAKGQYIQFLDADDELKSEKIIDSVKVLEAHNELYAVVTDAEYLNDITKKKTNFQVKLPYKYYLYGKNPYPINCVLFRNDSVSFFREDVEYYEDWLFWFENLNKKQIYYLRNNYSSIIHVTGENTSNNYVLMSLYAIYIRALIKTHTHIRTPRLFLRDIRLSIKYLLFHSNEINHVLDQEIEQQMSFAMLITKLLLFFPLSKRILIHREEKYKNSGFY